MGSQRKQTDKIELVETQNIALALRRLKNAPNIYDCKWKRALYHALLMSGGSFEEQKQIREALKLP